MKHYLLDALLLVLMFLFINGIATYFHESVHRDICESFGGRANVTYGFLLQGGKTGCTTTEGGPYHIMNDIISYNASILVITLFVMMVFLSMHFSKKRLLVP